MTPGTLVALSTLIGLGLQALETGNRIVQAAKEGRELSAEEMQAMVGAVQDQADRLKALVAGQG